MADTPPPKGWPLDPGYVFKFYSNIIPILTFTKFHIEVIIVINDTNAEWENTNQVLIISLIIIM